MRNTDDEYLLVDVTMQAIFLLPLEQNNITYVNIGLSLWSPPQPTSSLPLSPPPLSPSARLLFPLSLPPLSPQPYMVRNGS